MELIKTKTNSFIIVDGKICYIDEYFRMFVCEISNDGNFYMDIYEKIYLSEWQNIEFNKLLKKMYE